MRLLSARKRVILKLEFRQWCKRSTEELSLNEAPFTWEVAEEVPFTRSLHRGPGDGFLVATANTFDLTLVTADERLIAAPGLKVLANQ